jgi:uncharacterized protein
LLKSASARTALEGNPHRRRRDPAPRSQAASGGWAFPRDLPRCVARVSCRASGRGGGGRTASTAIYYLLARGERSHWHRTDAAEVWNWYAGAPLRLDIAPETEARERVALGSDLTAGERPQAVVPAYAWQAAETLGEWTLVGCTVAPGFDFAQFELAPKGWEPQ